jgi:hypothetical protein
VAAFFILPSALSLSLKGVADMRPKSYHNTEKRKRDADRWRRWLANPIISHFEMHALRLFEQICRQYGCRYSDEWHAKMRKVLEVLLECFEHDKYVSAVLRKMYDGALEDYRIGRGQAEIENWLHDQQLQKLSRQQQTTSKQEDV